MKIWNEADNMSEYKNILWIEDCDTNDKTGMKGRQHRIIAKQ